MALAREKLGWKHPPFEIPKEIYQQWDARPRGRTDDGNQRFAAYQQQYPTTGGGLNAEWTARAGELGRYGARLYRATAGRAGEIASRKASQNALNAYGPLLPELLGGSADLAPSNLTIWSGSTSIKEDVAGNYIHYGVREFGMTAISNRHCPSRRLYPYTSTFLMFVE